MGSFESNHGREQEETDPLRLINDLADDIEMQLEEAQRPLRSILQSTLDELHSGIELSFEDKKVLAKSILALMRKLGVRAKCPKTGLPAIIRCKKSGNSKNGGYEFEIRENGNRTVRYASVEFPKVTLMPAEENQEAEIPQDLERDLDTIDAKILQVHNDVISDLQAVFDRIAGTRYKTDEKIIVVGRINEIMRRMNAKVICPKTGKCGVLLLKKAGRTENKTIAIEVREEKKQTSHFSSMDFPKLKLVEAGTNPSK